MSGRVRWLGRLVLVAVSATLPGAASAAAQAAPDFVLRAECPPGFELIAAGVCRLRALYEFYDSLQGRGGFKVPGLRNVARTAPYMHSGAFAALRETVEFYNAGRGHAVPAGEALYLHWHIVDPQLGGHEVARLVDFLQAFTDESFTPAVPARVPSGLTPIDHPPATLRSAARTVSPRGGVSR